MNKNNIITVKNAEGDPDTQAEIIIQNKIDYIPKVSVIIPVYNVEEYLRECLDSVVNQTLKEIEIICVDDGSTDNSLEILKEYAQKDKRMTVIKQRNLHAGIARNTGLSQAKGEYLSFLDSDDFFELNMLEEMSKKGDEDNSDVVFCGYILFDNTIKKDNFMVIYPNEYISKSPLSPEKIKDKLFIITNPNPWTKLFKRKLFIDNDLHFESLLRCNDLTCIYTALVTSKKISFCSNSYIHYRSNQKSNITAKKEKYIDCFFNSINKLEKNLIKLNKLNDYYQTFLERLNNSLKWETKNCSEIRKDEIKNICKNLLSDRLYNALYSIKISVIISIYNVEKYLRECLDSVINQTLKNIEIICVNDGSTDNSSKILKEYAVKDKRIIIIEQKNQGLSCSRNNAMKIAKGEYIQFLDSDDYLKSDTIEKLYNFANKNDLELCSFSGYNFIDGENELLENKYWDFDFLPTDFNCDHFNYKDCFDFINKLPVSSCLTIYKNDFIKKHQFKFPKGLCFEDNVFYSKALLSAQRCGILKEKLYCRRIHGNSITQNWDKHFYDYIKIVDILLSWIKQNKIELYNTYKNHYLTGILNRFKNFNTGIKKLYIKKLKDLIERYTTCFDSLSLISLAQGICNEDFSINPPLLFKDLGVGCNTWCEPKTITGDNIKSYTYDLSDNIYTRYVSWDPIREGSCDVEIMRLSAIEKQSKRIIEFPINKIISNGEIINNKVEFHNQKGCWIGCKIEGTYESFSIEAKIKII